MSRRTVPLAPEHALEEGLCWGRDATGSGQAQCRDGGRRHLNVWLPGVGPSPFTWEPHKKGPHGAQIALTSS